MPRPRKPRWPAIPRRTPGSGSLSRNAATGQIRARLPAELSPTRTARKFRADELAEATAWLNDEVSQLRRGGSHTSTTPVVEWAWYWLSTAIEPLHPPGTIKAYTLALNRLKPLWALAIDAVRPSHIQREVGVMARRLSPASIQGTVSVWRRCFEAAVDDELLARNPVRRPTLPKVHREKGARGWTAREVRLLWAAIRGHRFEGGYALILGSGLRLGEVCGLHWIDVDLEGRRAYVHRQWTMARWRETPKGRNPHWIPLPLAVVAALIRHRDRQPPGAELVMGNPATGKPWGATTIRDDWRAITAGLGLAHQSNHAGRHGLASHLIRQGVGPAEVAALLGHASAATTLSTYSHSDPSDDTLARIVGEYLGADPEGG